MVMILDVMIVAFIGMFAATIAWIAFNPVKDSVLSNFNTTIAPIVANNTSGNSSYNLVTGQLDLAYIVFPIVTLVVLLLWFYMKTQQEERVVVEARL